jgi:hypothetical protein
MVYLDHAGATLYSEAQMADVATDLMSHVYGNPRILKFGTSVHKSIFSLDSYYSLCLQKDATTRFVQVKLA